MRVQMNACNLFGIALGVIVVLGIALNVPDIGRYIKLKAM